MSEKLIFWNFQILSRLQKNLYDRLSIKILGFFFIVIWSLYIDDHSYQISFSLDIPLSSYEAQHFKKMLLPPGTNRVNVIALICSHLGICNHLKPTNKRRHIVNYLILHAWCIKTFRFISQVALYIHMDFLCDIFNKTAHHRIL